MGTRLSRVGGGGAEGLLFGLVGRVVSFWLWFYVCRSVVEAAQRGQGREKR
jgi:hypothetical protein